MRVTPSDGDTNDDLLRDDAHCREAFRRGECWAMERVYQNYLPLAETVCTRGFGSFRGFFDPLDREDAVQSIFAAAFEERTRLGYDGITPYRSYLRGIAHNVIRQMLSSRSRFQRRPMADVAPRGDLETALIDAECEALLRRFRTELVCGDEEIIITRYYCEGCSEERLAAELGITRYRLRKMIRALHRRMIRYLEDHGIAQG